MKDFNLGNLKSWRKQVGLSQKKLSELARISLVTLRQLEIGSGRKPHQKTLRKLTSTIRSVEKKLKEMTGVDQKSEETAITDKISSKTEAGETGKGEKTASKPAKKRGKPPKSEVVEASGVADETEYASEDNANGKPAVITNLDLELINCILRMSNREKLLLLKELI